MLRDILIVRLAELESLPVLNICEELSIKSSMVKKVLRESTTPSRFLNQFSKWNQKRLQEKELLQKIE